MIYFLHVPKTAGQTLAARLASAFPPDRATIHLPLVSRPEDVADLVSRYDMVGAHTAWNALREVPRGVEFLAAVREPAAQIVSHYRHIRRDPTNPLHAAASILRARDFVERFADYLFGFQARALVSPFGAASPADGVAGEDLWLVRRLPEVAAGFRWLVPTESTDEFCTLWAFENGAPLGRPDVALNQGGEDDVDAVALLAFLRRQPERFAVDSLLWSLARRRHAEWRHDLLANGVPGAGVPSPGVRACGTDEVGVWLLRDWHAPRREADGTTAWWTGPGLTSQLRLRRGSRSRLRFEAYVFNGVQWDSIAVLRAAGLTELPTTRSRDGAGGAVLYEVDIAELGPDEALLLHAPEDVTAVPAVPLVLAMPRQRYATRNWSLA